LANVHWNYGEYGPDVWSEIDPSFKCNGHNQSPINIRTACAIKKAFTPLSLTEAHTSPLKFTLTNNGHTIEAKTSASNLSVTGGDLNGKFTFSSFHIHWGTNARSGSEHQMYFDARCSFDGLIVSLCLHSNGEKSSGESHFVYRNEQSKMTAVLSFLMTVDRYHSSRAR
jgi:carbonic anhydrase